MQVEGADRKQSLMLGTDQLDMREVASTLQLRTLQLQLQSQRMTALALGEASAMWSVGELRDVTGHAGSEADPFLFSRKSVETGVLFMAPLKALLIDIVGSVPQPLAFAMHLGFAAAQLKGAVQNLMQHNHVAVYLMMLQH